MLTSNWQRIKEQNAVDPANPRKRRRSDAAADKVIAPVAAIKALSTTARLTAMLATSRPALPRKNPLSSPASPAVLTSIIAMDCEMVGIGVDGAESALARCSIVNFHGDTVYDEYVTPVAPVTDYRTQFSGITPALLRSAVAFKQAQRDVSDILTGRILVGHSIHNDLEALFLSHPRNLVRDTAKCKLLCPYRPRALRVLATEQLGIDIQTDSNGHDSVEDARTVLALYKKISTNWERALKTKSKSVDKKNVITPPSTNASAVPSETVVSQNASASPVDSTLSNNLPVPNAVPIDINSQDNQLSVSRRRRQRPNKYR